MSGTTQMVRPKVENSSWTSTFPNEIQTEAQSKLFMKKLIAVAISSITYLRAIFPEHAFGDKRIEDLHLKILSENNSCPGACQVINWIRGCFDALEKKYLRQIMIGIYLDPDKPDDVIEAYTFRFSYEQDVTTVKCNDDVIASVSDTGMKLTKKATISLLRTIIMLMQSLDPLPDNAYLTMKLLYYDEVTPWDYEPPGFIAAETDCFYFKNEPVNIRVGDVATRFHSLKLRIKTDKLNVDLDAELALDNTSSFKTDKDKLDIDEELPPYDEPRKINNLDDLHMTKADNKYDSLHVAKRSSSGQSNITFMSSGRNTEFGEVECPCGSYEENTPLMTCTACGTQQHTVCFGILHDEDIPEKHICEKCSDIKDPRKRATDEYLSSLPKIEQQAVCLWRKTLLIASQNNTINMNLLVQKLNVEKTIAKSLLDRLIKEDYASKGKGKKKGKIVTSIKRVESVGFSTYMKPSTHSLGTTDCDSSHAVVANKEVEELSFQASNLDVRDSQLLNKRQPSQTRKRRSVMNETGYEFDISDSQETHICEPMKPKRMKSSVSGKGISV